MNTVLEKDAHIISNLNLKWEKLEGKTVFITGATGFIGSSVINTLMTRNKEFGSNIKITAMVRSVERAKVKFAEFLESGLIDFAVGDVRTPVNYDKDVDYIIHCASNAGPKEYAADPIGTMKTNFDGTFNLLELAKEKNVKKFLYVSTIEVFGTTQGEKEIGEKDYGYIDASNTRSCYPISKKACETATICFGKQYDIPVSIGRLSYIFGPGMKKDDSKIVAILARDAAKSENLVLKSKGEQLRSYTYIADAVSGLLTVMLDGENGEAYNIASSLCVTTIANIAYTLEDIYKDRGIKVIFDLASETEAKGFSPIRNAVLDNKKLKTLGWKETTDLRNGFINMVTELELDGFGGQTK